MSLSAIDEINIAYTTTCIRQSSSYLRCGISTNKYSILKLFQHFIISISTNKYSILKLFQHFIIIIVIIIIIIINY